jgi:prophage DNA circulation protein
MDADALKKMTVAELREEAKKLGDVKGLATMKKDGLVALLSGGASAGSMPGKTGALTRADLKQKIRALKSQRVAATQHSQRAKVEEFNTALPAPAAPGGTPQGKTLASLLPSIVRRALRGRAREAIVERPRCN